jgi:hypothetical protein
MSDSTELNYIFFGHQNRFKQYLIDSFNECIKKAVPETINIESESEPESEIRIEYDDYEDDKGINTEQEPESKSLIRIEDDKGINTKIRFCNGAILHLSINSDNNLLKLKLSLIYDGDKSSVNSKKAYWTIGKSEGYFQHFKYYEIEIPLDKFKSIFNLKKQLDLTNPLNLYFVRHGYSFHNQKGIIKKFQLKTNTQLVKLDENVRNLLQLNKLENIEYNQKLLENFKNLITFINQEYIRNNPNSEPIMQDYKNEIKEKYIIPISNMLYPIENAQLKKDYLNEIIENEAEKIVKGLLIKMLLNKENGLDVTNNIDNLGYIIDEDEENISKFYPNKYQEISDNFEKSVVDLFKEFRLKADKIFRDKIDEKLIEKILVVNSETLFNIFLENTINNIVIEKNGEFQAIRAGDFFSNYFGNNTLKAVLVSDLIRTQETAGFFLSQLTDRQFPRGTPIVVLPCLHELRRGEKDGQITFSKVTSQASRIFTLGTTQGVLNRENNTNCRATKEEKNSFINPFERKDCSTVIINKNQIPLDWEIYKTFYNGYRDQNNFGRKQCKDHHFIGIFLDNIVNNDLGIVNNNGYALINNADSDNTEGGKKKKEWYQFWKGGTKKRKSKNNRKSKSRKVRKMKRTNKTKKGKRRETRRK